MKTKSKSRLPAFPLFLAIQVPAYKRLIMLLKIQLPKSPPAVTHRFWEFPVCSCTKPAAITQWRWRRGKIPQPPVFDFSLW